MAKLKVRLLVRGENFEEIQDFRDQVAERAREFARRYDVHVMNTLDVEQAEDYQIELDVEKLGENINWAKQKYPSRKVKQAVLDIVALAPHWEKIRKVMREVDGIRFEERYSLATLTDELVELVTALPVAKSLLYFEHSKQRTKEYLLSTRSKEVKHAYETTKRDAQRRQEQVVTDAKKALRADIKTLGWEFYLVQN